MSLDLAIYVILVGVGVLVTLMAVMIVLAWQGVSYLRILADQPRQPRHPPAGKATLLMLALAGAGWASSPAEAVAAAHADLAKLPPPARRYQRYLSAYHVRGEKPLALARKVSDFWVNSLSLSTDLYPLAEAAPGLWRLDVRNYGEPPARDGGLFAKAWEKLAASDPYFHSRLEKVKAPVEYEWKKVEWEGGDWPNGDGSKTYYPKGAFTYQKRVPKEAEKKAVVGQAVGVDPKLMAGLAEMAVSEAPVLRYDWFVVETSQQTERLGTGYFDWLGIKDRDAFDRIVALDRALAEKKEKEVRAIVPLSGVALNNRQVIRLQTINGGYWKTLDVVKRAKREDNERRNAVRNLDGDFVHDAEEIYGVLPNGLFAYFAGDAKGNRQDSVPDNVASDKASAGNEARIHPASCVSCHKEGIRPIADWGRKLYKAPLTKGAPSLALSGPDYEKQRRLQKLYLSELEEHVLADQAAYAKALFRLTALKPAELAAAFGDLQNRYRNVPLGFDEVAAELGAKPAQLVAGLKTAALTLQKHGYYLDPSFAGLLQDPPLKMRREYLEELFTTGVLYTQGVVQIPKAEGKP